mmetsp:Transcript_341/g.903  ORF Transcript_341/g.903 Transcript_341/m.903 type:complete len:371 (-) Transcript_341:12-1124(-)
MSCFAPESGRLKETKVELSKQRGLAAKKDLQLQEDTARLLRAVNLRQQEAELASELQAAGGLHKQELEAQEQQLQEEQSQNLLRQLLKTEETERATLQEADSAQGPAALLEDSEAFQAEAAEATRDQQAEIREMGILMASLKQELLGAHDHVRILRQERDSEAEAASVTQEAYLAESRASVRQHEALRAEARTRLSEVATLEDTQRGLDGQSKALQNELSKVSYTVGQRDHELKVKDSELQEVKSNLAGMQDEMDEVSRQLKVQCERVQRVERELSLSRDLGEKVKNLRHMLQESHGGITQLCGLVDQERQRREQCSQGLKQQRMRTELLLQLLQHFKNRTQDLAPQTILAGAGGNPGACGAAEPMTPTH